jgi:hypothetical protein
MGQSSNDVIPTAMHVSARVAIKDLIPALERLRDALRAKAEEFDDVVKIGRTHLMDATPVRLGQEFGGYASAGDQASGGAARRDSTRWRELPLGGTAVGTGTNAVPEFPALAIAKIGELTGLEFREAKNHFEAQGAKDAVRRGVGAAQHDRGVAAQDRQRHPLARQRAALRHRRDHAPGDPAGELDHAGKGEPGDERGDDDGVRAGDRERHLAVTGAGRQATSS